MNNIFINRTALEDVFTDKNYRIIKPYPIVNKNDTVFVSAGIQPLLQDYRKGKIESGEKVYVAQPVIRTQYVNGVEEGSSIGFINVTTSSFNHSEKSHQDMIKDWYDVFLSNGFKREKFSTKSDILDTTWGDLTLHGSRIFHYYDGLEIGDTTFFTEVTDSNNKQIADSFSDLGFGLERLKWKTNEGSFFDIYSSIPNIPIEEKAYLSVIALLAVNDVKPSNKNSGYRARLFSKKLASMIEGRNLSPDEERYLNESISYWNEWQETSLQDKSVIYNELTRNGNRFILDKLQSEGSIGISGIDINVSREEFKQRLSRSGIDAEKIKKLVR